MKKLLLAIAILFIIIGYGFYQSKNQDSLPVTTPPAGGENNTQQISPTSSASNSTPSGKQATYKDGTYTGDVTDAYYGNIQVQITVTGGKITDVAFLQYPNSSGHSSEVSSISLPVLKQEAIQAQSAQVDAVSGATQTSQAFVESLSSALAKAQ